MTARQAHKPQPVVPRDKRLADEEAVRRILRGKANPPSPTPHPHFLPQTPEIAKNGKKVRSSAAYFDRPANPVSDPQVIAAREFTPLLPAAEVTAKPAYPDRLFCHEAENGGKNGRRNRRKVVAESPDPATEPTDGLLQGNLRRPTVAAGGPVRRPDHNGAGEALTIK